MSEHERSNSVPYGEGFHVEKSIVINRPRGEVYGFWKRFENLPSFLRHVESIEVRPDGRTHWVVEGPAGTKTEWDAETVNEVENELIAWRTVGDSEVSHSGSVHFDDVSDGNSTRVTVILRYDPPAGKAGAAVVKFLGADPASEIEDDLQRLRSTLERGNRPVTGDRPVVPY